MSLSPICAGWSDMLTMVNSSSMAMTTSTASRESKPRSEVKDDEAETCRVRTQSKEAIRISVLLLVAKSLQQQSRSNVGSGHLTAMHGP